jgi:acyl-coenzyme A synthetase/AMP-(fatty) acid ligase
VQTAQEQGRHHLESEPGEIRTLTYQQLHHEVQKFANVLKSLEEKGTGSHSTWA